MFPIGDDNPTRRTAYVTYGLIGVNLLVFLYEVSLSPLQLRALFEVWAVVPLELTAQFNGYPVTIPGTNLPETLTLLTSQFLHGGWAHLGGNMLFLWIFGNNVEDRLGSVKYLLFYLASGAIAGLCQWFFAPLSAVPSLGASGAIAGVMGAYILRYPRASILTLVPLGFVLIPLRIAAFWYLGIWFLQQALYGLGSLQQPMNIGLSGGGIAYWAHAGGFVAGAVLGPLLGLFKDDD
ncbi:peptidase S54 [Limnothrix sp. PR1529]|uniref:rhomboid family intramembrane serine protease n=1 Tax=Limnothrix sp. PR1529 TaxID=1704291 RepID=UPI00081D4ECF|nr:rhomboid family intramembrane serine protease [Limnothrix sp. PR1529]OCQ96272.1 rhomboid family intramembrane serine protease [Limnothrix sp. P13C2]PIB14366.1 peptidase S54 [Limnothrix sp. PR1529]